LAIKSPASDLFALGGRTPTCAAHTCPVGRSGCLRMESRNDRFVTAAYTQPDLTEPNDSEVILLAIHLIQLMPLAFCVFKNDLSARLDSAAVAVARL